MKRIAVVLVMIAIFASLALTGCMPTGGGIEAAGDGTGSTGGLMGFLPLVLIIVVFYFILIRPQNKKNKQVTEMRSSLKRGDWVTTIGGFKGRVVRIKDDLITIEVGSDKVKLDIMRWGISKIDESAPERATSTRKPREKDADGDKEKEAPKRKPKKLEPVQKKDEDEEDIDDFDDEDETDDEE